MRIDQVCALYFEKLHVSAPQPMAVADDYYIFVLEQAIKDNRVIPEDFNWYDDLPEDANA